MLGILREFVTREMIGVDAKPQWLIFYVGVSALVAERVFRCYSEPLNDALRRGVARFSPRYPQK